MNLCYRNPFLLKITLLFPLYLSAQMEQKIWIKTPQMSFNEFNAHIESLGFPHISYAQYILNKKREQTHHFQLKDKFLKAQEFYLSGEGEKAKTVFQKIIQLSMSADWNKEDQRIILYSFLRTAQIEKNIEKRKALLLSASNFILYPMNSKNYPDYDLFPPPIMKDLQLIQEKSNALSISWKTVFPNHEIILINGKIINKNQKIKIPQAFYRVTALSSSHQAWSKNLNLSELITQTIKTKSLTTGFCKKMKIKKHDTYQNKENIKILPVSKCPKVTLSPSIDSSLSRSQNTSQPSEQKSNIFSSLSPWIIAGAGIVALSLFISFNNNNNKGKKKKEDYIY